RAASPLRAADRLPHLLASYFDASPAVLERHGPGAKDCGVAGFEDAAGRTVVFVQAAELEPRVRLRAPDRGPVGWRGRVDDGGRHGEVLTLGAGVIGPGGAAPVHVGAVRSDAQERLAVTARDDDRLGALIREEQRGHAPGGQL